MQPPREATAAHTPTAPPTHPIRPPPHLRLGDPHLGVDGAVQVLRGEAGRGRGGVALPGALLPLALLQGLAGRQGGKMQARLGKGQGAPCG